MASFERWASVADQAGHLFAFDRGGRRFGLKTASGQALVRRELRAPISFFGLQRSRFFVLFLTRKRGGWAT